MNKKRNYILVAVLLFSITRAIAFTPEYYKVLASKCSLPEGNTPVLSKAQTVWKASSQESKQGFAFGSVGISEIPRKDFIWNIPRQKQELKTFMAQGEFRSSAFVLRALKNTKDIVIKKSDLTNKSGNIIAAENINIQKVKFVGNRKKWTDANCFLVSEMPQEVPVNSSVWFWITLYAPLDCEPGLYKGNFTLEANQEKIKIPVIIRILNIKFKMPEGAWGLYLPGHFFNKKAKGAYKNYCPEWWTAENLPKYMKFLKTRGLNSLVLFHVYPELSLMNGIPQVKFPFLNAFAETMKQTGITGPWGIDTRFISWWAHSCALKLANIPGPPPKDLKIYGFNALNTMQTNKPYGEIDKKIYGEAIKKLLTTAKQNDWRNYLLFSEEEIGYPSYKTKGYEAFNSTLTKIAGLDKIFLVDNSIGYSNDQKIDRGERDHLKIRSYNNWTQEGIADANKSNAKIWSYNMGWSRIASGVYVEKIGATGYHQWADHWYSKNNTWKVTILDNEGVVTSTELERTHEGLGDLFWFRKYDEYMIQLKEKGFHKQFLDMGKNKKNMFRLFPVQRYSFFTTSARISDNDLDIMRWKCILAIDEAKKLLGEQQLQIPSFSNPSNNKKYVPTQSKPIKLFTKQTRKNVLYAVESDETIKLDMKQDHDVWKISQNRTDRFRWTGSKEGEMRARAGSEEEFNKMPAPSGTGVSVAYDKKGIYLKVGCNHVDPKCAKYNDDSPVLWKDDCMEFFFNKSKEYPIYQLIVNSQGKRTLLKDKAIVKCNIQVVSSSPLNATGGVEQKIFIPWKDLGQNEMPQESSLWRFNVCREFHSYRQFSSWVQVYSSFGLADGLLCFNGPVSKGDIKFKNSDFYNIYFGENKITSKLSLAKDIKAKTIILQLQNAEGITVDQTSVIKKNPTLSLSFKVPAYSTAQTWTLQALGDGKILGSVKIAIPAAIGVLKITQSTQEVFLNDMINIKLHPCIGNNSLKDSHLIGYFENTDEKHYSLAPCLLNKGNNLLSVSTQELEAGQYKLVLMLKGFEQASKTILPIMILPSPY